MISMGQRMPLIRTNSTNQVAADDQPDFGTGQVSPRFDDAQKGKVTHDGAFTAFFDGSGGPTIFWDRSNQLLDADRAIVRIAQAQTSWVATTAFPIRHIHCGSEAAKAGAAN